QSVALRGITSRSARIWVGRRSARRRGSSGELHPGSARGANRSDCRVEERMSILQDVRYALRSFARSPALVSAAVVCLALGIGANATIFGVVDTLLFRAPPHVQDPDRVVRLYFRHHSPSF